MNALQAFGNLADHHPHAVLVIAIAVALFGVVFAFGLLLADPKVQNTKRRAY
jgi:hypothetical protein